MISEDVDEWKAFLQYAIDRALDYGVDSVSVVNRIASTISGRPTLSVTSSTRVSELLLSSLDIADARSLPSSLFELINETLVNTYPPTVQNKVPSLWLLRTLTRTIDACPVEIAEQLLENLQEGICQWILDEQCVLTGDEYGMDVLPMYQTVLARMMGMPLQITTITNLAQLVESAFCGRGDKPEGTITAFVEFWESTYASIPEPEDGWSEAIVHCLEASTLRPVTQVAEVFDPLVADNGDADDEEVESQLFVTSVDDVPSSPILASSGSLAEAFVLSPELGLSSNGLQMPETPTKQDLFPYVLTPGRAKQSPSPLRLHGTPFSTSPVRPFLSSPQHSPATPKRRTPASARSRAENFEKENMSPLRNITPVAERIAKQSPRASVLGKRRFDADDDEGKEMSKRARPDMPFIFGNALQSSPIAQRIQVNMAHVPSTSVAPTKMSPSAPLPSPSPKVKTLSLEDCPEASTSHAADETITQSPTNPKKRKGVFLEAVVVPTLREVMMRRAASFDVTTTISHPARPLLKTRSLPSGDLTLRRTRSTAKLLGDADKFEQLPITKKKRAAPPRPLQLIAGKRKRIEVLSQDDVFSVSSSSLSSPLQRLKNMETMGSGESTL